MCKAISSSTLLVFVLILTVFPVSAQTPTGIISGTVTDESGALIANAAITIINKTTGATRSVTANASGIFSAPALDPGEYEVRAQIDGLSHDGSRSDRYHGERHHGGHGDAYR